MNFPQVDVDGDRLGQVTCLLVLETLRGLRYFLRHRCLQDLHRPSDDGGRGYTDGASRHIAKTKKPMGMQAPSGVCVHIGLLFDRPTGDTGLPFI